MWADVIIQAEKERNTIIFLKLSTPYGIKHKKTQLCLQYIIINHLVTVLALYKGHEKDRWDSIPGRCATPRAWHILPHRFRRDAPHGEGSSTGWPTHWFRPFSAVVASQYLRLLAHNTQGDTHATWWKSSWFGTSLESHWATQSSSQPEVQRVSGGGSCSCVRFQTDIPLTHERLEHVIADQRTHR
jgi:hypothetical protein